jgi:hypothetical protein
MSYSYIKSVFPKFESSKVYDERIYNSLSTISTSPLSFQPNPLNQELQSFTENLVQPQPQAPQPPQAPQKPQAPQTPQEPQTLQAPQKEVQQILQQEDNLKFYNQPLILSTEEYENENKNSDKSKCDEYCYHALSCPKCSSVLTKQLGIMNDKARIEEMMELGSYIIFGIFMLLLLESIKKK